MNKLIFNNKEYELIQVRDSRVRVFGEDYEDIGFNINKGIEKQIPLYEYLSLRIKDKFYGLKLIENEE